MSKFLKATVGAFVWSCMATTGAFVFGESYRKNKSMMPAKTAECYLLYDNYKKMALVSASTNALYYGTIFPYTWYHIAKADVVATNITSPLYNTTIWMQNFDEQYVKNYRSEVFKRIDGSHSTQSPHGRILCMNYTGLIHPCLLNTIANESSQKI